MISKYYNNYGGKLIIQLIKTINVVKKRFITRKIIFEQGIEGK